MAGSCESEPVSSVGGVAGEQVQQLQVRAGQAAVLDQHPAAGRHRHRRGRPYIQVHQNGQPAQFEAHRQVGASAGRIAGFRPPVQHRARQAQAGERIREQPRRDRRRHRHDQVDIAERVRLTPAE